MGKAVILSSHSKKSKRTFLHARKRNVRASNKCPTFRHVKVATRVISKLSTFIAWFQANY